MSLRILLPLSFLLFTSQGWAQAEASRIEQDMGFIQQQGQLFTLDFSPKSGKLRIKFAGKSIANYNPDNYLVTGQVYDNSGHANDLHVNQMPAADYQVAEGLDDKNKAEFVVKDKTNPQKSEKFQFDLKKKKDQNSNPFSP